jgi:hypothetical protein
MNTFINQTKIRSPLNTKSRMYGNAAFLLIASLTSSFVCAADSTVKIGSVKGIISQLDRQNTSTISPFSRLKPQQQNPGERSEFFEKFDVQKYSERDGQILINGNLRGRKSHKFQLRGTRTHLSGRQYDPSTGEAALLNTDSNGVLVARQTPISRIIPDLSPNWAKKVKIAKDHIRKNIRRLNRLDLSTHQWVRSALAGAQANHVQSYSNQDLLKLESKPNSKKIIYLNFTQPDTTFLKSIGLSNELPVLNLDGSPNPINVAIKEKDGDTGKIEADRFINVTKEDIYRVWQVVAAHYSSFDVNITTNRALFDKALMSDRYEVMFFNHGCRSWATLDAFGTDSDPAHMCVDSDQKDSWSLGVGYTAAHEIGHGLGLQHQGDPSDAYFNGLANHQWVPIMGNFWYAFDWEEPLVQFTKGEYKGAVSEDLDYLQDDRAVIAKYIPIRNDDIAAQKPLTIIGQTISPSTNYGTIERSDDVDVYEFRVSTESLLDLQISPIEVTSMLDIRSVLTDSQGRVIIESSPISLRDAKFERIKLAAGNYRLEVRGGAEGTPSDGFSAYSSTGYYAMLGSLVPKDQAGKVEQVILTQENISNAKGTWKYFSFDIPSGNTASIVLSGGTGDADLYVKKGAKPQSTSAIVPPNGCSSDSFSANEKCFIKNLSSSTENYQVGIFGYKDYQNITLKVSLKK